MPAPGLVPKKVVVRPTSGKTYTALRWVTPRNAFGVIDKRQIDTLSDTDLSKHSKKTFQALLDISEVLAQYQIIKMVLQKKEQKGGDASVELQKVGARIQSTYNHFRRIRDSYYQIKEREKNIIDEGDHSHLHIPQDRKRIEELLSIVPEEHLEHLEEILIAPESLSSVLVWYNPEKKGVILSREIPPKYTLYYGIGYHVYDRVVSEWGKKVIRKIFRSHKDKTSNLALWGLKSEKAFFAESYKLYLTRREYLQHFSKYMYEFLNRRLFAGYIEEDELSKTLYKEHIIYKDGAATAVEYLLPGEAPPEGFSVIRGPRGGRFYIPSSKQEIEETISNLNQTDLLDLIKRTKAIIKDKDSSQALKKRVESVFLTATNELDGRRRGGDTTKPPELPTGRWNRPKKGQFQTKSGSRIPPGWSDVWVSSSRTTPLQAIGRDIKGRAQYLYSAQHSEKKNVAKFKRLKQFHKALPKIMKQINKDLVKKEEAQILFLISKTGFRVGSTEDTMADEQAYGASTFLGTHVTVTGSQTSFNFTAKKGVKVSKTLDDARLARVLRKKVKKGNKPLFSATGQDVRTYLNSISDSKFTPKDFRTYIGTSIARQKVNSMEAPTNEKELKSKKNEVAEIVAKNLGNTAPVALSAYIDTHVFASWEAKLFG